MTQIVPEKFLLAGEMKPLPQMSLQEHYQHLFKQAKVSAKGVNISKEPLLSWKYDKEGKYFTTVHEKLVETQKFTEYQIQKFANAKNQENELQAIGYSIQLASIETKLHILDKENKFQTNFKKWIMGEDKTEHYKPEICWWITPSEYQVLEQISKNIENVK
jgi:hypothetical protein